MSSKTRARGQSRPRRAGTGRGGEFDAAIIDIDPHNGKVDEEFAGAGASGQVRSPWYRQLAELIKLHQAETAQVGVWYAIGTFSSAQGAANRKRLLEGSESLVPLLEAYVFEFRAESFRHQARSVLWARLVEKRDDHG